jgi:hypothetical protein
MSSIYTDSHPCATSVQKMVFIIIWKVAGELVSPKNITVGSNNPSGVRNAAFHLSPFLMHTLLYPQRTLNKVNKVHLLRWSIVCGISGDMFQFFLVHLLIGR